MVVNFRLNSVVLVHVKTPVFVDSHCMLLSNLARTGAHNAFAEENDAHSEPRRAVDKSAMNRADDQPMSKAARRRRATAVMV